MKTESSLLAAALLLLPLIGSDARAQIDLDSLLEEMVDRAAIARLPDPPYTCRQFSSYDRGSVSPDDPETWFANYDRGHHLRVEERDGRQEWVMMDAEGPGAIVRFWSANPAGTLRVYLDGAERPVLEAPLKEVLGGTWEVGAPLAAERAKGWNLYLPIPYAKHCKVTSDEEDFYYQINYRTYPAGTEVASFSMEGLESARETLDRVQRELSAPSPPAVRGRPKLFADMPFALDELDHVFDFDPVELDPSVSASFDLEPGPAVVTELSLRLDATDLEEALRQTVLVMVFDGRTTVWCPLGDFFGSGIGLNPYRGWWREAREDGTLLCRWTMPYQETAEVQLVNLGLDAISIKGVAFVADRDWDDRSMHFHTTWRQQDPIRTLPRQDWNYVEIQGQGVFAGDSLALTNPSKIWWGEGDEKFWVDGEDFPSHFGTGTEDYYGYAWGSPDFFEGPFHAQPRCDGPGVFGHTTVTRTRSLDAIPFERSLRFDMEVWHWRDVDVGYAATTYFYARPGATTNREPAPEEAARGALHPPPLPPPYKVEGALECEDMEVLAATEGIPVEPQGGFEDGVWSATRQLWVQGNAPGDFVEIAFPAPAEGPCRILLYATRSWDYGVVTFSVNGKGTGYGVDLYNLEGRSVATTGPLDLGVHEPRDGRFALRVEVVAGNPLSEGTRSFFGLDCVVVAPAD